MKILIWATIIAALILFPFYKMRARWAIVLWQRIRLVAIVYVVVIFIAAVSRLIFNFDAIYG